MRSLTELELRALGAPINLADGHPRQDLTEGQRRIIARLPELYESATSAQFEQVEHRAQQAFLGALGQRSAPLGQGRIFSVYSSSVATMILATWFRRRRSRVALLHPTFDNLHDLLEGSAELVPMSERAIEEADLTGLGRPGDVCIFVTVPNNPTGWHLTRERLEQLATACAEARMPLCVDTSFRGFDVRTQFDTYEILERARVEYVVIEDTGKLWPLSELKLGFIAVSEGLREQIGHVVSDVLLSVSPFVLRLVEELALDATAGSFALLHDLIAGNRQAVAAAVDDLDGVEVPDCDARISVCRVRFRSPDEADRVRRELRGRGVHVLPCRQFHWARPEEGATHLRLAIARQPAVLRRGLELLHDVAMAGSREVPAR